MGTSAHSSGGLPAFDQADPQAYYLIENREELEALSDAVLVAEGVSLCVHSQVLSMQSGVLRRLFVDFRGTAQSSGGAAEGSTHSVADTEGELVLKEPLAGCTVLEAALFLRFCYHPDQMDQVNLKAVQGSLPAVLRLAHKLEVGRMQQRVGQHMADASGACAIEELIVWADAAEDCEQTELRLACTAQLAQRLVAKAPGSLALASGIADAAQLEGCSKITLLLLLGLVTGVGRQLIPSEQLTAYKGPGRDDVSAALQQAANPGSYEWRIERFSQQPEQPGQKVQSPWFEAGGREWRLAAYLGGRLEEHAGHVSLYLDVKQDTVQASVKFTVCDQDAAQPQHVSLTFEHEVTVSGWGFHKLISLEKLRSRPGYLAGDTLVIRAEVQALL